MASTTTASSSGTPAILSDRSINAPPTTTAKPVDFHRQLLQSKLSGGSADEATTTAPAAAGTNPQYFSPSDTIMSPCTAKLSAYKSRRFLKAKPQTLLFSSSKKSSNATGGGIEGQGQGTTTATDGRLQEQKQEREVDGDGDVEMGGQ